MKSPQTVIGGSGRENITEQACINAEGMLLPPYILYSGKYLMADTTNGGPLGTRYNDYNIVCGLVQKPIHTDYLQSDQLSLSLMDIPLTFPRQLAIKHNVHLLKLPPHLTNLLQPLDVGVFKPHW